VRPVRASAIKAWLERHPRFHMHFTPTGSSWIDQVERWFGARIDRTREASGSHDGMSTQTSASSRLRRVFRSSAG